MTGGRASVIAGCAVLLPGHGFQRLDVALSGGRIAGLGHDLGAGQRLDGRGLFLLPGIVDVHGDAFERQIMPRPGVQFPLDLALVDSDRQILAHGITTAFHGITWSWEPGLRGTAMVHTLLDLLETLAPQLGADTRVHLRFEAFNVDAAEAACALLDGGRIGILAFNDHLAHLEAACARGTAGRYAERAGLTVAALEALLQRTKARAGEVPAALRRLGLAARRAGLPVFSHDDPDPDTRRRLHALGARVCEFPETAETARMALALGGQVVCGAPNVIRGGSHAGKVSAGAMVAAGLCTVLASDYYYPALLAAPFTLARDGVLPLERAWDLVSTNAARVAGLADRGAIAAGLRADLVLVEAEPIPSVVATFVGGRLAYAAPGLVERLQPAAAVVAA
ncbi:alpha-D-ribose 1-methylphosphonate 5-triphosphate diphosphatase [Zavarzinia sp. CC-PAN008]|uniref:alpha-D-ribose 1-methylphosphonate 5-triphosphate diphosphatase n=1 Tax=Zavarzinia sp. CC-PAN008 TaxID=3243332 RepID=UPI003F74276E